MSANNIDHFIKSLEERAKELNCLFKIEEILNQSDISIHELFNQLIDIIPTGFQYIPFCHVRVIYEDNIYQKPEFKKSKWKISTNIKDQDKIVGVIEVYYSKELPDSDVGPFLKEEEKLINTICERISHYLLYRKLKRLYKEIDTNDNHEHKPEWAVVLDLLKQTDKDLFSIISRKMIITLFTRGIKEAADLFARTGSLSTEGTETEINKPSKKQILQKSYFLSGEIFDVAQKYLKNTEILDLVLRWTNEERTNYLIKIITDPHTPINEITDAIRKYINASSLSSRDTHVTKGTRVSLIRKFLSDQLEYINIAKNYMQIRDFDELLKNLIFTPDSQGKLGGKAAGLFLAKKIIEYHEESNEILKEIRTPKTWYMTSDSVVSFIYYNNFEDIIEQKYKDINEIRSEYSYVVQAIKNSTFPPELLNGLSRALDDFGDNPIIVRSSSLLEDRLGAVFAGKYKSLFLANQGTKQERLESLCDAVAEVFASVFGPDPIGYRIERGLLDFNEEMGIMIQEVVGTRVDDYFFPAFAGVAFSYNEFRWSPRIEREDGLIRLVPGLGTRAVDRIGDDYPILIAPGKPNFRLNLTFEQLVQYSPKSIDLINLNTNTFETLSIDEVISKIGNNFPQINDICSIKDGHFIKTPVGLGIDTKKDKVVVTFENILSKQKFTKQIHLILKILQKALGVPVDIEFASANGELYLLQARPQSSTSEQASDKIPENIPDERILFKTTKYVTNANMPDIKFIVYVDPEKYSEIKQLDTLKLVGITVGKLNRLLPKNTFILMGPGRWGSRGDIRLGVSVSYTDINNTAMLIEIAKAKGNYIPDLSFGTHFFQDLVESNIKYLPLYPDDNTSSLNIGLIDKAENQLSKFIPEFSHLSEIIKVIDVAASFRGKRLLILLNADIDEAVAFLADKTFKVKHVESTHQDSLTIDREPWAIRWEFAEKIADAMNPHLFGVFNMFLIGTVFNKTATVNSDIDLLVHYNNDPESRIKLESWFDAWNIALRDLMYEQTGIFIPKFIDVLYFTDVDLSENNYFASLVDANQKNSKTLKLGNHD